MALSDYVDINISLEAETVDRIGFGTLLFITEDDSEDPGTMTGPFSNLEEVDDIYDVGDEPRKFAAAAFAQGEGFSSLVIYHKNPDDQEESWVESVGGAIDGALDWFAVGIETRETADIVAVANEIEARGKLFIGVSDEAGILDPQDDTDIASTILDQSLSRTGLLYYSDTEEYPEAAWFGRMLPEDPGAENWAYKSLATIPTDSFTSAQRGALRAKRCNYYETVAGNAITFGGYTSEPGVFLDIVRGLDWLQTRMQEDFIARQTTSAIPYRSPGPEIIESIIRSRLEIAVDRGVITEEYEIDVPAARDQQASDRADRFFPGVTFNADLVGFANIIEIRGTVAV